MGDPRARRHSKADPDPARVTPPPLALSNDVSNGPNESSARPSGRRRVWRPQFAARHAGIRNATGTAPVTVCRSTSPSRCAGLVFSGRSAHMRGAPCPGILPTGRYSPTREVPTTSPVRRWDYRSDSPSAPCRANAAAKAPTRAPGTPLENGRRLTAATGARSTRRSDPDGRLRLWLSPARQKWPARAERN